VQNLLKSSVKIKFAKINVLDSAVSIQGDLMRRRKHSIVLDEVHDIVMDVDMHTVLKVPQLPQPRDLYGSGCLF